MFSVLRAFCAKKRHDEVSVLSGWGQSYLLMRAQSSTRALSTFFSSIDQFDIAESVFSIIASPADVQFCPQTLPLCFLS